MKSYNVHGKELKNPSFFQVYNFGGGNGDKNREIVYSEFTGDTPALINYYYINNNYKHIFASRLFNDIDRFNSVGKLYNYIRDQLILNGEIYNEYQSQEYDFNNKIFLLDSGAYNIVKYVAQYVDFKVDLFVDEIVKHVVDYYDFANKLKFDIVVGFDLGGKYTEKDGEKDNNELNSFLSKIDKTMINKLFADITIKYMKDNPDFHPYVLATVHGETPEDYKECVLELLKLEKENNYRFWGFALGGIASYKQLNKLWYEDIDLDNIGKKGFIETIAPARASKLVRSLVGDRPIHALGCGGYNNIALLYYNGATSFDSASPVRRVGDGSLESTKIVFNPTRTKIGFSKYFIGGINFDGTLREEDCVYVPLNEVPDTMSLCGCNACNEAKNINRIKILYSLKEENPEAGFFSRQLIGLHAVYQHYKLCEIVSKFNTFEDFFKQYNTELNEGLLYINKKL